MVRCPVCCKEKDNLQCPRCGFDGSCDYERYPTLTALKGKPDAVSRRREALGKPETPKGTLPKEKAAPRTLTERLRSAPRVGAFQTAAPVQNSRSVRKEPPRKEEKRPRHWMEKTVLVLGWVYLAMHLFFFLVVNGSHPQLHCPLIAAALLMQLRLQRKGFAAPFTNKLTRIAVRIVNFLAQALSIPGALFVLCLPFMAFGALMDGQLPEWEVVLGGLALLYHFLWHFLLTVAQGWNHIFSKA